MTNTVRISNQQGCGLTCDHQVGGVAPVQMQGHQGPRPGELDVHFQLLPVAQHLQLCMLSRKLLGRQEIERDPLPLPAGGRGMRTAPAGPVMAGSSGTSWDSDSLPFCISYLLLPKMLGNQSSPCHALGKKAGKSKLAVAVGVSIKAALCCIIDWSKGGFIHGSYQRRQFPRSNSTMFQNRKSPQRGFELLWVQVDQQPSA